MDIINVGAVAGGEAFLLIAKEKTALLDTGFGFCGDKLVENIKRELGGKGLDYVLLSHSHYDHVSALPYILETFPEALVCGSAYTKTIFTKENAKKLMREMDDSAAELFGQPKSKKELNLKVDRVLFDGDTVDLGDVKLETWSVPGHTKCSIAFYSKEEKLLLSCESFGVYGGENVVTPCFLVSDIASLDGVKRAKAVEIEKLFIPHYGLISGQSCAEYLKNAECYGVLAKEKILSWYNDGKCREEILELFRDFFYNDYVRKIQPQKAFDLNAVNIIGMIIRTYVKN